MIIKGVACIIDGVVYCLPRPYRHYHLIRVLIHRGIDPSRMGPHEQGFWVLDGIFINRYIARKLIDVTKQNIIEPHYKDTIFSEDLW